MIDILTFLVGSILAGLLVAGAIGALIALPLVIRMVWKEDRKERRRNM